MRRKRLTRAWGLAAMLAWSLAAVLSSPSVALADATDWTVTYTTAGRMVDDYDQQAFARAAKDLQPGDQMTLSVTLVEENGDTADWYMLNKVLDSLEDATAQGGAYLYHLEYESPDGDVTELFDSERVGGDGRDLSDATTTLEDYFYLDTLESGERAIVRLGVELDGDTQGDVYFNTDAILALRFAVEPREQGSKTTTTTVTTSNERHRQLVRTGDDRQLLPLYVAMVVSGVGLAVLTVVNMRLRRQESEGGAR